MSKEEQTKNAIKEHTKAWKETAKATEKLEKAVDRIMDNDLEQEQLAEGDITFDELLLKHGI